MDINNIRIEKFICGDSVGAAQLSLAKMLEGESPDKSYADMLRFRVSNRAAKECLDTYYVAHDGENCFSRLWNGWGRHKWAVGNFGNFVTVEEIRGQGLGHKMLEFWHEDIKSRNDLPICFLCMGEKRAAKLYFPYGFRPIEKGAEWGPLYMPLGDSPQDFRELCESYYKPADLLLRRPASLEWRHEIDCLLKYCLWNMGLDYTINGRIMEQALLYSPEKAEMIFTEEGKCIGWIYDGDVCVHPKYKSAKIY